MTRRTRTQITTRPLSTLRFLAPAFVVLLLGVTVFSQVEFDGRRVSRIDIQFDVDQGTESLVEQYRSLVRSTLGESYSATKIRDSIAALYGTDNVETVIVRAAPDASGGVVLTYEIKRKTQVQRVAIELGEQSGDMVTEEELLFKLNLLEPGKAITEQVLRNNADVILDYLRERGFYRSAVTFQQRPLTNANDVAVTFRVVPNEQATVSSFVPRIDGYTKPFDLKSFQLQAGKHFSRDRLTQDIARIRSMLRSENFLAPELNEPDIRYNDETNTVSITLTGKVGPTVRVLIETEPGKPQKASQTSILPVLRDGTLDYSAIIEGARRLENYYQEQGYFFARVNPVCTVAPQIVDTENNPIPNGTSFACSFLNSGELMNHEVEIKYVADLGRRYKLTDIRIEGTDKLTIDDVRTVLRTKEASALAIVPVLGYGRGYTSDPILEEDRRTIESLMHELGYRQAKVHANRGVSITNDELIITFVVDPEGPPTIVNEVSFSGNVAIPTAELERVVPAMKGQNFSRARMRNGAQKIRELYFGLGYFDARVTPSYTDVPGIPADRPQQVNVLYRIENERQKVVINRVLVEGNQMTELSAARKAITLREGELLKSTDIYQSESNLYSTDAFSRVTIKPRPAGEGPTPDTRLADVIVSLEEQPARLVTYGGGFSTDLGLNGFFDIRHVNLFGKLWQGGARVRASKRQQLVQLDFINPRFIRDRKDHFAPLTISALYQRDTTVTRFFRSTFDKGTFGIVQRIDQDGNPIDTFGQNVGSPTINRLSVTAETNRTLSRGARSLLFVRYRFEDVRLFNIGSLLIKDLLEPERKTRISGFGATFVRDTRRNCAVRFSLLDIIARGEPSDPCRYNAGDPTHGQYLTAEYNVSVPQLGANIGFHKFQASYNYYYSFGRFRNTTFAARGIIGVGRVFAGGDRFTNSQFPSFNGLLPISERFFAGGGNNLRGFDFEEAGPRVVIMPQGTFRDRNGDPIGLDPFTVPFGGNALAVVNIEGRIPVSGSVRVVPFYDGGNVFRRPSEIFKPSSVPANDIVGRNQRAVWTHTAGLGLRLKTPVGGEFGVDYAYMLNPPVFLIPQGNGPNAEYRLKQGLLHFRFSQAF